MSHNAVPVEHPSLADRMRSFSSSPYTRAGSGLWGLGEGIFFFIVPDVITTLAGLFRLRAGLMAMAFSIVGSLLSAVSMYLLVAALGESTMVHFVGSVPFISQQMVGDVSRQLAESGLAALVLAPLQAVPYKIYSVEAAVQGIPLWSYLLWSVLSRLERLLPTTLAAGVLGIIFRKSIQKHTAMWLAMHLGMWVLVYVGYWVVLPAFGYR